MSVPPFATKTVRGCVLRADPAREACFKVVDSGDEMEDMSDFGERSRRERLHRHMNNEMGAIEIAAQCLVDFPDTPWDLRMQLARQCYDESRHVAALLRRLIELGGHKGEFPVANYEWGVTCMVDNLAGRLAIQNRTFEAGLMDLLKNLGRMWVDVGDATTADVLENILADEVGHVRFGNQWIRKFAETDRRVLFKVAQAVGFLAACDKASSPNPDAAPDEDTTRYKLGMINIDDRRHAEFTDDEIEGFLRKHGLSGVVPDRASEVAS